jgi:hypothetical protein
VDREVGRRSFVLRVLGQVSVAAAGLWLGAAVPLFLFLLTGVPLAVALGGALVALVGIGLASERRISPPARAWLRVPLVAAACGIIIQGLFALCGGWTFGG